MEETIRGKRYLAFLDILGFKELIENNELDYLEALYDRFEPSLLLSYAVTNLSYRLKHMDIKELPPIEETHLNSMVISDSILIWTDDDSNNSFVDIVSAVRYQLFLSIELGLPLRGVITMGDLLIKSGRHEQTKKMNSFTTILGSPLTRAYLQQAKLNSMGCMIDEACIRHFEQGRGSAIQGKSTPLSIELLQQFDFIKRYFPSMKNSNVTEKYLINWTHYFNKRVTEGEIREAFSAHNKSCDSWEVEDKILNSIKFLKDTDADYLNFLAFIDSAD